MSAVEQFTQEKVRLKEWSTETEQWRSSFIKDFPREKLAQLSMDDYLYAMNGYGNRQSFCSRLWKDEKLCSLGNCRPEIFGLYYADGTRLTMHKRFQKLCGDEQSAYQLIRSEMVDLLNAGEKGDLHRIANNKLISPFKTLLLSLYFKYDFAPIPTKTALYPYCDAVGIACDKRKDSIYWNAALVEWMKEVPEMEGWTTHQLMLFLEWLHRGKIKIDGAALKSNRQKQSAIWAESSKQIDRELDGLHLQGKVRAAIVKVRVNQGEYRKRLLERYSHCCLCRVQEPSLLIASHIKPWADSEPEEKLDPDNGLLLCPNHDKLFDQGFISFEDDGMIRVSEQMTAVDKTFMNVNDHMKIEVNAQNGKFLRYHREHVFRG